MSRTLAINFVVLFFFTGFTVIRVRQVVSTQAEAEAKNFPVAATAFLQQQHPPGPMMNNYNWGGYFIWKLYPQYRVFMDGRADVYGDALMTDFSDSYYLTGNWRKSLQTWNIQTVVLPPDASLGHRASVRSGVEQIYSDSEAALADPELCRPPRRGSQPA